MMMQGVCGMITLKGRGEQEKKKEKHNDQFVLGSWQEVTVGENVCENQNTPSRRHLKKKCVYLTTCQVISIRSINLIDFLSPS